jgi:hypothetical protein
LRGQTEHVREAAGIECRSTVLSVGQFPCRAEQPQPQFEWILLRGVRDLVDETLHDECVRGVGGRAPRTALNA